MLGFVPSPYPDEILYSVLARYHVWSMNAGYKHTLQQLFGTSSICTVIDFPSHLGRLGKLLPEGTTVTIELIIEKHTLLPLFRPFLPPGRVEKVAKYMMGDQGQGVSQLIGAMPSSIPTLKYLRYCPQCLKSDFEEYGEAYWHRTHQLQGVTVCPRHLSRLSDSEICVSPPQNKTAFKTVSEGTDLDRFWKSEYLGFPHANVAQAIQWILDNKTPVLGFENIRERYLTLLQRKDLTTYRRRVRQEELAEAINGFFSPEYLKEVYSTIEYVQSDNWLARLLRRQRSACHPLRHVLLILFLEKTPEEFFTGCFKKISPFGEGPWPCLNPVCNSYRRDVISTCQISKSKEGNLVGTFSCQCGFVYARRGSDKDFGSRYKIGRIKKFGEIWHSKLMLFFIKEKCSLRETARRLCVDPQTVKYQLAVCLAKEVSLGTTTKEKTEVQLDSYRYQLQILIRMFPDKCRTEIRKMVPAVYTWLYRNDREWLFVNLPPPIRKNRCVKPRVDWDERDRRICSAIRSTVPVLKEKEPLVRISISLLGKHLGCLSLLQKHLGKLPRTREYLKLVLETVDQFQDRRILHVIKQMKSTGIDPTTWKVMRKAGLKKGMEGKVESIIQSNDYISLHCVNENRVSLTQDNE
ncbi:TnsD family transposase [Sporomusa sphaeroides]|uniref:TnsD family transposase n=1 Tax=Sporomusa sphaeroides TaxID=47679 RepID=UPI002B82515B|nr:TnsD family transposase [Sporomusa sphaeroides]HML31958.1 TnsD family transposase [Sporomusa sphaeroides]